MSSSDPGAATSIRRMATVVSSVPEASKAASITSRLGAPPVPMINREVNSLPAMINGSASAMGSTLADARISTTLHRRHDLHLRSLCQFGVDVLTPGNHLAVDRDRDAAWGGGAVGKVEHVAQPNRRSDLPGLAVDMDDHRVRPLASAKRSRANGAATSSSSPLVIKVEMTSAVIGVRSTPLR